MLAFDGHFLYFFEASSRNANDETMREKAKKESKCCHKDLNGGKRLS